MEIELNKSYLYRVLDMIFNEKWGMIEYGNETCGEHFLVYKNDDKTISFVLDEATGRDYIYKCIYKD